MHRSLAYDIYFRNNWCESAESCPLVYIYLSLSQVEYDVGSGGNRLPPACHSELDTELIPVIHQAAANVTDQPIILELLFHVLRQWVLVNWKIYFISRLRIQSVVNFWTLMNSGIVIITVVRAVISTAYFNSWIVWPLVYQRFIYSNIMVVIPLVAFKYCLYLQNHFSTLFGVIWSNPVFIFLYIYILVL